MAKMWMGLCSRRSKPFLWILGLTLLLVGLTDAFTPSRYSSCVPSKKDNVVASPLIAGKKFTRNGIILRGIDFDAIDENEECDFFMSSSDLKAAVAVTESPTGSGGVGVSSGGGTAVAEPETEAPTMSSLNINPNCIELPTSNQDITPEELVTLSMNSLMDNDTPKRNAGLEVCFNFSSDSCRASNGGSLEAFIQYGEHCPVFQYMVNCLNWKTLSVGPEIPGTNTRGAMKTMLVEVTPRDDKGYGLVEKRFIWTLMKERRPPRQGCWLVHECISVDNAFAMTE